MCMHNKLTFDFWCKQKCTHADSEVYFFVGMWRTANWFKCTEVREKPTASIFGFASVPGNFASPVFHSCNAKTQKTQICVTGPQCVNNGGSRYCWKLANFIRLHGVTFQKFVVLTSAQRAGYTSVKRPTIAQGSSGFFKIINTFQILPQHVSAYGCHPQGVVSVW
jgi:hypothetical protein